MNIRQETPIDYEQVNRLVERAFEAAKHRDGNEHKLVAALRESDAFIPELSLVAETDGKIVGHILFTKISIGSHTALALAPLSVLPEYQNRGIGMALMQKGHRIAGKLGYQYSVVLGSDKYYPRVGYAPAEQYGIQAPFPVLPGSFMALPLREDAGRIEAVVTYAKEFEI